MKGRCVEGEVRGGGGVWRGGMWRGRCVEGRYVEGEVCGGGGMWRGGMWRGGVVIFWSANYTTGTPSTTEWLSRSHLIVS